MVPPNRVAALAAVLFLPCLSFAAEPRVLPPGQLPNDVRLGPLKELDGYFPFDPPKTLEAWEKRRAKVQRQLQVAVGLFPKSDLGTPISVWRRITYQDSEYRVESVVLAYALPPGPNSQANQTPQSPWFITGNLYLPNQRPSARFPLGLPEETISDASGNPAPAANSKLGTFPGILCPYGHWPDGRFMDAKPEEIQKQLASGAEQFESAARSPLQARCVQLARMGCVVFHYDMIGRGDSTQIPDEIAHLFKKARPEMNGADGWGFFTPRAEAHLQSIMGMQTLNSLRAMDFLCSLPEVDRERIGVTGASGGATQTMMLAALDDRVKVAFPAVMVSTAMQGGCTCENCSLLRADTGNVEIAALFAPKPMAMTAANDWTKEMATKGFPQMQEVWKLYGAEDRVQITPLTQFPHNYNAPSRAAMYAWFNKYLNLNLPAERLQERDFRCLSRGELTVEQVVVFEKNGQKVKEVLTDIPPYSPAYEKAVLTPPPLWPPQLRQDGRAALEVLIGRTLVEVGPVEWEVHDKQEGTEWFTIDGLLQNERGEELPALSFHPKNWKGHTVLWLDERGKIGLCQPGTTEPTDEVRALLAAGISVFGVDLIYQGEFLKPGEQFTTTRRSKNPREVPAYTFGYNYSVFAQRVQDVLTVRALVEQNEQHRSRTFSIFAPGNMGPIAAAARALLPRKVHAAVIGEADFRFENLADVHDPMFLPGAAKYGDLPGMLGLAAPEPVLLLNQAKAPLELQAAYSQESAAQNLHVLTEGGLPGAVDWLIRSLK